MCYLRRGFLRFRLLWTHSSAVYCGFDYHLRCHRDVFTFSSHSSRSRAHLAIAKAIFALAGCINECRKDLEKAFSGWKENTYLWLP